MEASIDNLKNASGTELMLRYKRASLVLLISEIKKLQDMYERESGNKAPSLLKLVKDNLK